MKIQRGWENNVEALPKKNKLQEILSATKVTSAEQLPELISAKEAAKTLRQTEDTIKDWFYQKKIQSIKIGRHRFTTPQWIADYLMRESAKHG